MSFFSPRLKHILGFSPSLETGVTEQLSRYLTPALCLTLKGEWSHTLAYMELSTCSQASYCFEGNGKALTKSQNLLDFRLPCVLETWFRTCSWDYPSEKVFQLSRTQLNFLGCVGKSGKEEGNIPLVGEAEKHWGVASSESLGESALKKTRLRSDQQNSPILLKLTLRSWPAVCHDHGWPSP